MELKNSNDGQVPDSSSYYQNNDSQQNPYGQSSQYGGQNPYGQSSQYGGQNPYGQQGMNPGTYNGFYDNVQSQATFNQSLANGLSQSTFGNQSNISGLSLGAGETMGAVSAALVNSVLANAFFYMFLALLVTAITALIVASSPTFLSAVFGGGQLSIILIFALELGLVFATQSAIKKNNLGLSATLFFLFSAVNGLTFSVIFMVFELSSIVTVFFMTSVVFGTMAAYGFITKKDLTGWGPYLFAGLIGILAGSIINIFLGSSGVDFGVTIIGVIVFTLYTAYDVNKIRNMSRMNTGLSVHVLGMYGAMELYLDFINLFLKLLRLFGKRRR